MHLLIATDGSRGAVDAARFVASLPLDDAARITMLAVTPMGTSEEVAAFTPLDPVLAHSPASLAREVRHGVPAEELLKAEEALTPDLLVLGASGLSAVGRFWTGSVAERVATYSRGPVLVVWPGHTEVRQLVVGIDPAPESRGAVSWLQQFRLFPASTAHLASFVTLFDVFNRWRQTPLTPAPVLLGLLERQECARAEEQLRSLAADLGLAVAGVETHVRLGDAAQGLLRLAEEVDADLIVVEPRGLSRLRALYSSSVSDQLLTRQDRSLLVIRQPDPGGR